MGRVEVYELVTRIRIRIVIERGPSTIICSDLTRRGHATALYRTAFPASLITTFAVTIIGYG